MQINKNSGDDIETLKLDFCNKYSITLPKRTAFITTLKDTSASDFD